MRNTGGRPRRSGHAPGEDRDRILAAARALVEREGVGALSARAVSREAGTALGSIYPLFGSVEGLRLEVNAATLGELGDRLEAALGACAGAPPEERLIALAAAYTAFSRERRPAWEAILAPRTLPLTPESEAVIAALFGLIESVLAETGRIEGRDLALAARALWASVHGMVQLGESGSLGPIAPGDLPAMIAILVRSAVRGLGPGEAPAGRA